jgi:fucose permease
MIVVFAALGAKAFYLLYVWLGSAIVASYLSERKGYGSKVGLAFGLLLSAVGAVIWILVPARSDSRWKLQGPFGSGGKTVAEARAESDARTRDGS